MFILTSLPLLLLYHYFLAFTYFLTFTAFLNNHDPNEFTARKQGAVSDQSTTQDQISLFSIQATSWKFSNIHHFSKRFALTHAE